MASLLLSAVPATHFHSAAAPRAWAEGTDARTVEEPQEASESAKTDAARAPGDGASSVRPRGQEAPVSLRQIAANHGNDPAAVGAGSDPGDGPPPARNAGKTTRENRDDKDGQNANVRLWPMPAESYTFTQPFGCVPQIAHFYQPGAGCPADRPVVHTGLDMAAPEGTPFYAAASGWVTEAGYDREVGVANTRIIIQHEERNDGFATEYLHWVASFVDVGDHVEAGQLIGEVGSVGYSTGPHLHFSLIDLDSGEHVDPTRWLPKEPGTEGYRGITPRRAAMRLPAGTTAGVPEYTDPSPPEVPAREDVPESADSGQGRNDRNKRKKEHQREERRNGKSTGKNRNKDTRDVSGKDGSTSENNSATPDDKTSNRERERTRKRERNRDGVAKSNDASGDDASGGSGKERRNKNADGNAASGKDNNRKSRKDENVVEQTDTRDKDNNRAGGGGGGNKKNRQQDHAQQVDKAPEAADEAPSGDQGQPDENGSGRDGKDDNGAENPDGSDRNAGAGQDNSTADTRDGGKDQTGDGGGTGRSGGDGGSDDAASDGDAARDAS